MKQSLVVYYSQTGNTRQLAERLAAELDADLEEIRERQPRHGALGMLRSLLDALFGREPDISAPIHGPSHYARVIVGGPVWADHIASPVRSYLVETSEELPALAFFCSCGRDGAQALADMASLCDCRPDATLRVLDREIAAGDFSKLPAFVASLRATAPATTAREQAA